MFALTTVIFVCVAHRKVRHAHEEKLNWKNRKYLDTLSHFEVVPTLVAGSVVAGSVVAASSSQEYLHIHHAQTTELLCIAPCTGFVLLCHTLLMICKITLLLRSLRALDRCIQPLQVY